MTAPTESIGIGDVSVPIEGLVVDHAGSAISVKCAMTVDHALLLMARSFDDGRLPERVVLLYRGAFYMVRPVRWSVGVVGGAIGEAVLVGEVVSAHPVRP